MTGRSSALLTVTGRPKFWLSASRLVLLTICTELTIWVDCSRNAGRGRRPAVGIRLPGHRERREIGEAARRGQREGLGEHGREVLLGELVGVHPRDDRRSRPAGLGLVDDRAGARSAAEHLSQGSRRAAPVALIAVDGIAQMHGR